MNKLKLFTFALLLLLAGCNSVYKNAKSYYETQHYVRAVYIITANKDDPPTPEKMALVKDSIDGLDKTIKNTTVLELGKRVALYEDMLKISEAVENTPYQNASPLLSTRYKNIKYLIANEYYMEGRAIYAKTADEYELKISILNQGMQYYSLHEGLQKELVKAREQYAITSADENYAKAKQAIQEHDYQKASTYLDNVIQSYKNYGKYKDANKLFAKYDPIWRKQQANNDYNQATQLLKTANNYNDYRTIAQLYRSAAEVNKTYGGFKNSRQLAEKYENQWQTQEAEALYESAKNIADNATSRTDHRIAAQRFQQLNNKYRNYNNSAALAKEQEKLGHIYVHFNLNNSGDNSLLNHLINGEVTRTFNQDEFRIDNNKQSDFFISIIYIEDTRDHKKILSADTYKDENRAYIEIKERLTRTYVFRGSISVGGKMNYEKDFTIKNESVLIHTFYKGNPPGWARESKEGTNLTQWGNELKSDKELALDAMDEINATIKQHLDNIKRQAQNSL